MERLPSFIVPSKSSSSTGTGDREGDSYQRVHVDDGVETLGIVDRLVPKATAVHVHLGPGLPNPLKGKCCSFHKVAICV